MSMASKCDRCGKLFEVSPRCLSIERILVATDGAGGCDSWSEIDFCGTCSGVVLGAIGDGTLRDLPPR